MKRALISGITGQDGSYLSELLLEKGYEVLGIYRRTSTSNFARIYHLLDEPNFKLVQGEITDSGSIFGIFSSFKPDEFYHLAAQSHVGTSFEQPFYTSQVNYIGTLNCLEAIRRYSSHTRMYFAGSSEQFGSNYKVDKNGQKYQDETTTMTSRSPYGTSKIAAFLSVKNYREAYGLFCCSGLLHNHESARRGEEFVTRKITKYISEMVKWYNSPDVHFSDVIFFAEELCTDYNYCFPKLRLGNIEVARDWGHSKDYVRAMWMLLQQSKPDDFVVATGEAHTVREFLEIAFKHIGITNYENFYVVDSEYFRASDIEFLRGDSTKIRQLGWAPTISFDELVTQMVEADLNDTKIPQAKKVLQKA